MRKAWRAAVISGCVVMVTLHVLIAMTSDAASMTTYVTYVSGSNDTLIDQELLLRLAGSKPNLRMPLSWNNNESTQPKLSHGSSIAQCDSTTKYVIFVYSAADHVYHRRVIRKTWASQSQDSLRIIFIVGKSADTAVQSDINKEKSTHRDVMSIDIEDSYASLTPKSIAMLRWLSEYCVHVKYVLKVDDDSLVNIPRLINDLDYVTHKYFIMGDIIAGAQPMRERDSKWYTPHELYPMTTYPDYVSGSAYVISGDLIRDLYHCSREIPQFWLEDVFITGMCSAHLKATLVHNAKFKSITSLPADMCAFSGYLTMHRVQPFDLPLLWSKYVNKCL